MLVYRRLSRASCICGIASHCRVSAVFLQAFTGTTANEFSKLLHRCDCGEVEQDSEVFAREQNSDLLRLKLSLPYGSFRVFKFNWELVYFLVFGSRFYFVFSLC